MIVQPRNMWLGMSCCNQGMSGSRYISQPGYTCMMLGTEQRCHFDYLRGGVGCGKEWQMVET